MYLTFVKAVVIILKHATQLCLSNIPPGLALTSVELGYQEANINSKIHEHLMVSSQVKPIETYADFIMATDIGWSLASLLHPYLIKLLVSSQSLTGSYVTANDAV